LVAGSQSAVAVTADGARSDASAAIAAATHAHMAKSSAAGMERVEVPRRSAGVRAHSASAAAMSGGQAAAVMKTTPGRYGRKT
jgi:hypothetical protein